MRQLYTQKKSYSKQRWSDFTAYFLLFLLFALTSTRLQITHWADDIGVIGWLLLLGAVVGFFIGKSRIKALFSVLLLFLSSLIVVPGIFMLAVAEQKNIVDKFAELVNRISTAASQLIGNQPVTDSILFILGMGVLFWVIGTAAGFTMVRTAHPWIPLLVLGGALFLIEHYQPENRRTFYTWAYAFISLILLGRIYFLQMRNRLEMQGVQIGEGTNFDFMRGVIVAAFILGLAGWGFPRVYRAFFPGTLENSRFTERWDKFSSNFEHLVFALDQTPQSAEETAEGDLELGTGQQLGTAQVLYVVAERPAPLSHQYYWRVRSYDVYQSGKWTNASLYSQSFHSLETLPEKNYKGTWPVEFRFTSSLPSLTMLYSPGTPTKFNRQLEAAITPQGDELADIVAYYATTPIKSGGSYRVDSAISVAAGGQLQEAGSEYPDWILDRYLQLPSSLSPRIIQLSQQLTQGKETPFDKAAAITAYLRNTIKFQATISTPPKNQDPIDWFLFDYQKGFCNYYASAEVLLLRAAGVPARISVGYTQGEMAGIENQYVVREKHSHAWPEVYFPAYGWIAFEPTGSQPVMNYLVGESADNDANQGTTNQAGTPDALSGLVNGEERAMQMLESMDTGPVEEIIRPKSPLTLFGKILVVTGSLLGAGVIVFATVKIRKNRKSIAQYFAHQWQRFYAQLMRIPGIGDWFIQLKLSPAERCFWPVERGLRWAKVRLPESVTAAEMVTRFAEIYPDAAIEAENLLNLYQNQTYGRSDGSTVDCSDAGKKINRIVFKALVRRLTQPIRRLNERFNGG